MAPFSAAALGGFRTDPCLPQWMVRNETQTWVEMDSVDVNDELWILRKIYVLLLLCHPRDRARS